MTAIQSPPQINTEANETAGIARESEQKSLWDYLNAEVDPADTTGPLVAFSFMTGFLDAVSFSAAFVWCGFQTGNFAQLAISLARLFEGPKQFYNPPILLADLAALISFITFQAGSAVGRVGDRIGSHKRIWLVFGTLLQALLTMAAAICIWKSGEGSIAKERGQPSWSNGLSFIGMAFMSASLGVQGVVAKRLNTQFGTTIVLTTVWVELAADPQLFHFGKVTGRDHKLLAAGGLFLGAVSARVGLSTIGSAAVLGIGVGIRVLIAIWFVFVKEKPKPLLA